MITQKKNQQKKKPLVFFFLRKICKHIYCAFLSPFIECIHFHVHIHLNQFKKEGFSTMPKFDSAGCCTDHNALNLTSSVTYSRKRGRKVCPLHLSTNLPLFTFGHHVPANNRLSLFLEKHF